MVCQHVEIDNEYENDEIQKRMKILEYRRRQKVASLEILSFDLINIAMVSGE